MFSFLKCTLKLLAKKTFYIISTPIKPQGGKPGFDMNMYKNAATAKTQFGMTMNSTKVMAYLFSSLNMMWNILITQESQYLSFIQGNNYQVAFFH
jgi:hypothetical protein